MRAWIRILDGMPPVAMNTRQHRAGREKVRTTRLRIGQNCRAVCTKKSASGHS